MKLVTDKSHRDYYYKHASIEFDALFPPQQVTEINQAIEAILCNRMSLRKGQLALQNRNNLYLNGHDLWREDESLKKLFLHRRLAEIAGELNEIHSLRMGSDQLLLGEKKALDLSTENVYEQYLKQEGSLQERSCFRPVAAGLLVCLEPIVSEIDYPLFSKIVGSGVFFKPDLPLDLSPLVDMQSGRYILISYVDPRTVYVLNENEPHTHTLKHLGYVFGDRLSDRLNPLIFR
jgi:hypothetical protein